MPERLAPRGEVWKPGKHFEVLEVLPSTNHPEEITASLLLRIWREGQVYDLRTQPFSSNKNPGWAVLDTLPDSPCLVPVLHSYCAEEPVLEQAKAGGDTRQCLFLVQPVEGVTVRRFLARYQPMYPAPPFGLSWRWMGLLLLGMLRCVRFLEAENVVHGGYLLENFLLQDDPAAQVEPRVRVTGFHQSWFSVKAGRRVVWSTAADVDAAPLGGCGTYRAPEVHRAREALFSRTVFCVTPLDALPKAELWTVGRCMYDLLGGPSATAVFERLQGLQDRHYGPADLPVLPADTPPWLAHTLMGITRSDDKLRLGLADAIQLLEMGLAVPERAILTVVEKRVTVPIPVDRIVEKVVEVPIYIERIVEKPVERVVERVVEVPAPPPEPTSAGLKTESSKMLQPKMEKIIEVQEVQKIVEVEKVVRVPYLVEIITRPAAVGEPVGRFLAPKDPGDLPCCPMASKGLLTQVPDSVTPPLAGELLEGTPPCSPNTASLRSSSRRLAAAPDRGTTPKLNGVSPRKNPLHPDLRSPKPHNPHKGRHKPRSSSQEPSPSGRLSNSQRQPSLNNLNDSAASSARSSRKGSTEKATPRTARVRPSNTKDTSPPANAYAVPDMVSPRTASQTGPSPRDLRSPPPPAPPRNHLDASLGGTRPREDTRGTLWASGVAVPMDVDHLEAQRTGTSPEPPGAATAPGTDPARASYLSRYLDSYFSDKGRPMPPRDATPEEPWRRSSPRLAHAAPAVRRTSPCLSHASEAVIRRSPPRSQGERLRAKSPPPPASSPAQPKVKLPDPHPPTIQKRRAHSPEKLY
eukprot:EG_transcript_2179